MKYRIALFSVCVLAACGSSTTKASTSDKTVAATTVGAAATTTAAGVSSTTADPKFSGSGSGDLCSYAKEVDVSAKFDKIFQSSDPAQTKKDLDVAKAAMAEFRKRAPNEIKGDIEKVTTAVLEMIGTMAKYNFDFTALAKAAQTDPALAQTFQSGFASPEFQAASDRVDAYFTNVCGIKR